MMQAASGNVADLIEQVKVKEASDRNRSKNKSAPTVTIGIEEPIAWTMLFDFDVNRYFSDPRFYVEQTLRQKLWKFDNVDDDAGLTRDVPAWLGHYPEYTFVGMEVVFTPGGVPHIQDDHPLTRAPDLTLLQPVDFYSSGWMPRILRWYDEIEAIVGGRLEVPFNMTWGRGPLDLAIQLRGYDNFVADTAERPAFVHDLLKFLTEQRCRWWEMYYRHFGLKPSSTFISDDWINVPFISPNIFAEFVLPRYLEIEKYHGGIRGIHSCGNTVPLQCYLLEIKSLQGFEVSAWTDLAQTLINLPPPRPLWISVHPNNVLCDSAETMRSKIKFIKEACRGRKFNLSTSGLTPLTAEEGKYVASIQTWLHAARELLSLRSLPAGKMPNVGLNHHSG